MISSILCISISSPLKFLYFAAKKRGTSDDMWGDVVRLCMLDIFSGSTLLFSLCKGMIRYLTPACAM